MCRKMELRQQLKSKSMTLDQNAVPVSLALVNAILSQRDQAAVVIGTAYQKSIITTQILVFL